MMKPTLSVLALFVFLGGCGSCQRGEEQAGGRGAVAPTAAAESEATAPVEGAPPAPVAGEGQAPAAAAAGDTTEAPPAAPPAAEAPLAADVEDCIVIMDAEPDYGPPPLTVSFSAEAECSTGPPTYTWDFGDGSPKSTEASPSHTYSKVGDYTATVTVTGPNDTTSSDEIDITVEAEEELE